MKIKKLSDIASIADYLKRIGAEERSMRTAVIKERAGNYSHEIAVVRFSKTGEIDSPDFCAPTDAEAKAIADDCKNADWPQMKMITRLTNLPDLIKQAPPEHVFEFRNMQGEIIMLQVRTDRHDGQKRYTPWTYWDDNEWRAIEPEGKLPLWGMEQLKNNATVFIHEGAKAARAMRDMLAAETTEARQMLKAHPWAEELAAAAHVGWIGGALSPARTDWEILKNNGVTRAYIVSDNDAPGVSAVPTISQNLRMPTFHIQFTNEWPVSFDLADPFPEKMFVRTEGTRHYIGPSFRSCTHPATWATDLVQNKKGKPSTVLRKHFVDMWAYVEEADIFVCVEMPEIVRAENVMNKMLSAFSHSQRTSELLIRKYRGRSARLCYRPDITGKVVTANNTSAINLHTPTHVKRLHGDAKPWIEFMEYMFPNADERLEVMKWCATLIARPDLRMEYGMLLVSESQGIGKTTIGSAVLAPLVGIHNVGFPTESSIVQSEFNGWLANKRLVIVNEIYSGHSWKAYNKLKSCITDKEVEVNQKFQRTYVVENWAHIMACSNSMRALRMEEDDRRWFYPEVTETKWPKKRFERFHNWLRAGGLGIIMDWACGFGDYVTPGIPAPMTERKRALIADSRTEAQQEVARLAEAMKSYGRPMAFSMKAIVAWARNSVQGKVYDTELELRKAMKDEGVTWLAERIKTGGVMQYVAINDALLVLLREKYKCRVAKSVLAFTPDEQAESGHVTPAKFIYEYIKQPESVLEPVL